MQDLKIIYEDENILAIDKPAGLLVHRAPSFAKASEGEQETLASILLKKYPEIKNVGDDPENRPGIVHRLDKETSGVILIAKNQAAFLFLKNQFKERELQKTYIAIVYGQVKNEHGIIDAPIARSSTDFRRWSASRGKRGKEREAVTEYKVLKRFVAPAHQNSSRCALPSSDAAGSLPTKNFNEPALKFTLLELKPKTGRTHQIRVHMKFLNYPVVCDKLYAPNLPCPVLGMNRLALHAKSIEFKKPDGKDIKIEAPIPEDLKQAINIKTL